MASVERLVLLSRASTPDDSTNTAFGQPIEKPGFRLSVCVTGAGAGGDSAWAQRKLEARKMLVNRAESPASSARFVGWRCQLSR